MTFVRLASARRRFVMLLMALPTLAAPTLAFAQPPLMARDLEGVWRIARVVTLGVNPTTNDAPQPGLAIFYRGYFSLVRDTSREPRTAAPAGKDPANLTMAEKAAKYDEWAPLGATVGTYEIEGDRLITHNIVANQAVAMTSTEEETIDFEGDSFVAIFKSAPGAPVSERQTTYVRVR